MMRFKKVISGIIICTILLSGCSETDDGMAILMNNEIIDNSDISLIEYPEEVMVYEIQPWQKTQSELNDVFLHGDITAETYMEVYQGRRTEADFGEYTEWLQSLGRQDDTLKIRSQGIHYEMCRKSDEVCRIYGENEGGKSEAATLRDFFDKTMSLPESKGKLKDEQGKNLVKSYMKELEFPIYEVRVSTGIFSEDANKVQYMAYWQQMVDGIPISAVHIPKDAQLSGTKIYNSGFNHEVEQYDGILQTNVVDGEIVYWDMLVGPVIMEREVGSYKVISPQKACQKIIECYQSVEMQEPPCLEVVELQYKNVVKNGRQLLVPVWMFIVVEKEHVISKETSNDTREIWCYYLIDAISGEFFTDVEY